MTEKVGEQLRQANFFNVCEKCPMSCCVRARPPVTSKRKMKIENYLKTTGLTIENAFEEKNTYMFPRETEGNQCIFLDKTTKKCRIHLVKPETCVAGPVTFDINLKTGEIEWLLKTEKICPLAGELYKNKWELQSHLESARRELLRLMNELDAEALQAVLKIEEPDTFKIGEDDLNPEVLTKLNSVAKKDQL